MKKITFSLLFLLASANVFCQNTMGFRYQTVLRDLSRQVLVNENVKFRMSLLEGSPDGPALYAEKHTATTNQFGLVTFTIGQGDEPEGDFLEIPWGTTDIYLQVEIDPKGGNDFEVMGASLMLAVPIATWELSDEDRSPTNELQILSIIGGVIYLSDGNSITLPDDSNTNEIQTITLINGILYLSDGGSVTLPLQTLSKNGPEISLTNGGSVLLNDDDPYNEIQDPYLFGTELGLTGGNWTADLSAFMDSPWIESGFSQIYFPYQVAVGGSDFSGGARLTVNGNADVLDGSFDVINQNGKRLSTLGKSTSEAGFIATYGITGSSPKENFSVSNVASQPNYGYVAVYGPEGWQSGQAPPAGMYVHPTYGGVLFAYGTGGGQKNFVMPHPTRPDKHIVYSCIEGPEAAAYDRGTAQLVNGETFIPFSEHFEIVVNPTTMTVVLTPNDASSLGLAVVEKTATGIRVKELHSGTGNYAFDWQATAVRKGHEDFKVVRDAGELCPAAPAKRD